MSLLHFSHTTSRVREPKIQSEKESSAGSSNSHSWSARGTHPRALVRLRVSISSGRKGINQLCKESHWTWGNDYLEALLSPAVSCTQILDAKQVSVWAGCATDSGPHHPGQCVCLPGNVFPPSVLRNELRQCWWRCWKA